MENEVKQSQSQTEVSDEQRQIYVAIKDVLTPPHVAQLASIGTREAWVQIDSWLKKLDPLFTIA